MRVRGLSFCILGVVLWVAAGGAPAAEETKAEAPVPHVIAKPAPSIAADVDNVQTATPKETASAASTVASVAQSPLITLVLKADLSAQRVTVLEGDTVLHVWRISSGVHGYSTPTGIFQPQSANKMWYSRQYGWAPMPHAVFFTRGVAFHGTNAMWGLGRPASHGCLRLAPSDAAQLFALVHKHGFAHTRVIVYGVPKRDAPVVAHRAPPVVAHRAPTSESKVSEAGAKNRDEQLNTGPAWAPGIFNNK